MKSNHRYLLHMHCSKLAKCIISPCKNTIFSCILLAAKLKWLTCNYERLLPRSVQRSYMITLPWLYQSGLKAAFAQIVLTKVRPKDINIVLCGSSTVLTPIGCFARQVSKSSPHVYGLYIYFLCFWLQWEG